MADEFDESVDPVLWHRAQCTAKQTDGRQGVAAAKLVSRLYRAAKPPLRARLLACLLKPLGPLGLAAVAAGAFGHYLYRGGAEDAKTAIRDVARFSNEQLIELARFVEQVSPDAFQEFARLIADNPIGTAAFSASAVLLLMRASSRSGDAGPNPVNDPGRDPQE
jgi:hypothetical protein